MTISARRGAWQAHRAIEYNGKLIQARFHFPPKRMYWGADIPMRVIHRYARAIAEEFHPDKIILFGSYAWGTPHKDSDVDLLVVMPAYNQHNQAVRIRWRLAAPFPVDPIVRTPKEMKWRLAEGESFTTAIVSQGKVLYEKVDARVGEKTEQEVSQRPNGRNRGFNNCWVRCQDKLLLGKRLNGKIT